MSVIKRLSRGWQSIRRRFKSLAEYGVDASNGFIPAATRFFRNTPLISEGLALMAEARLPRT